MSSSLLHNSVDLNNRIYKLMGNFYNDLNNAKKAEIRVKEHILTTPALFSTLMLVEEPKKENLSEYDLNFHCKIEVKNDKYPSKNFAFEYYNPKKDALSGIWVSKADYIVYVTDTMIVYFETELLKEELLANQTTPGSGYKNKLNVGDGNAHIVLYDKDFVINNFQSIKYIEKAN